VSSSACTSRAIAGTVLPPAEASTTIARRNRIGEPVPQRVMRSAAWVSAATRFTDHRELSTADSLMLLVLPGRAAVALDR
jgi:hypothetical protein